MSYGFGATVGTATSNRINSVFNDPGGGAPITIAFSAKRNGAGGNNLGRVLDRNRLYMFWNQNSIGWTFHSHAATGTSFKEWTAQTATSLNVWHRCVMTWNGDFNTAPRFFANGVEVTMTVANTSTTTTTGVAWTLGNSPGNNRVFDGRLAEISIHDRALDPADALALSQSAIASSFPTGLIFYAPLRTDDIELVRNEDMSVTGAVLYTADNPTVSSGGSLTAATVNSGSSADSFASIKNSIAASVVSGSGDLSADARLSKAADTVSSGSSEDQTAAQSGQAYSAATVSDGLSSNVLDAASTKRSLTTSSGTSADSFGSAIARSLASVSSGISSDSAAARITVSASTESDGLGSMTADAEMLNFQPAQTLDLGSSLDAFGATAIARTATLSSGLSLDSSLASKIVSITTQSSGISLDRFDARAVTLIDMAVAIPGTSLDTFEAVQTAFFEFKPLTITGSVVPRLTMSSALIDSMEFNISISFLTFNME